MITPPMLFGAALYIIAIAAVVVMAVGSTT
jgi:hypothetical protein